MSVIPDRAAVVEEINRTNEHLKLLKRQLKLIDDYNEQFGEKKGSPGDEENEPVALAG